MPQRPPVSGVLSFYFRDEVLPYYAGDTVARARPRRQRLQVLGADAPRLRARRARLRLRPQQAGHRVVRLQEELGLRAAPLHYEYRLLRARQRAAEQPAESEVPRADRGCGGGCRAASSTRSGRSSCATSGRRTPWRSSSTSCTGCRIRPTRATRCARTTCCSTSATRHRVFLGTFVDDPRTTRTSTRCARCAPTSHRGAFDPRIARLAQPVAGSRRGEALTLPYYRNAALRALGRATRARAAHRRRGRVLVGDGAVRRRRSPALRVLVDFVDVDSAKWTQYADAAAVAAVAGCTGAKAARLLDFERSGRGRARRARSSSPRPKRRCSAASRPASATRIAGARQRRRRRVLCARPCARIAVRARRRCRSSSPARWTTGRTSMPCSWFAREVLPRLRDARPHAALPHRRHATRRRRCRALAGDAVSVTGTVPDVRPYLQHARGRRRAAAPRARHPEQGPRGDGDGAPGGRVGSLRRADRRAARDAICSTASDAEGSFARSSAARGAAIARRQWALPPARASSRGIRWDAQLARLRDRRWTGRARRECRRAERHARDEARRAHVPGASGRWPRATRQRRDGALHCRRWRVALLWIVAMVRIDRRRDGGRSGRAPKPSRTASSWCRSRSGWSGAMRERLATLSPAPRGCPCRCLPWPASRGCSATSAPSTRCRSSRFVAMLVLCVSAMLGPSVTRAHAVSARLPVLRGADRRLPAADADGVDRRLHRRRAARIAACRSTAKASSSSFRRVAGRSSRRAAACAT